MNNKPGKNWLWRVFGALFRWINIVRLVVVNLVFLVLVLLVVSLFSEQEIPLVPSKGALLVDAYGTLVEQRSLIDPVTELFASENPEQHEIVLHELIEAIDLARGDERINSMVLALDGLAGGSLSQLEEIGRAVDDFRQSGKKVIAVGDNYSQSQYWLATRADEVYLNPMGSVWLQGFAVYRNYFRRALDKLSIDFHIFRVGEFKSAMEPFMRDDMSPADKTANMAWLNDLWREYGEGVAERRGISVDDINRFVNTLGEQVNSAGGSFAQAAMAAKLIDGLQTRDESESYLASVVGATDDDGYYASIGFETYLQLAQKDVFPDVDNDAVGVIIAEGDIVDGYQPPRTIGGDSLVELIHSARTDDTIKAVVLRLNSGGGSVFASEIIRRELQLLRAAGKPLVVSMSGVAASGGYWISSLADEIWAMPSTLTGSIGIFGAIPTVDRSLAELGISTDGVGTTDLAGSMRIDRPLNPGLAAVMQQSIEYGYRQFLDIVAEGRDMPVETVANLAGGRVWSGVQARSLGLVDHLGGLQDAIASAAKRVSLPEDGYRYLEIPLTPQEEFLRSLGAIKAMDAVKVHAPWIKRLSAVNALFDPVARVFSQWHWMNDPRGVYAYCASCIAP